MTQEETLNILKSGRNVFLTGSPGSGKTYVLKEYIEYLRDENVEVAVTASTGIAATHLGGVTIHSWSGIGIKSYLTDEEIDTLIQKEPVYKKYKKTQVLIIDEVSMLKPATFDTINLLAKKIRDNDEPFGGMQVVLSGDFFQLPPVVEYGEELQYVDSSESWLEMKLKVCYLEEQFRQTDDLLLEILNEIRSAKISEKNAAILNDLGKKGPKNRDNENQIITKLYTHNLDVDELNSRELAKIKNQEKLFKMKTHGRAGAVAALVKNLLVPENLILKKDAVVMFVKNNFERGYVNGTLGEVVGFEFGCPIVETFDGKIIQVQKETWEIMDDGKTIATAEQFPLRLAWAITIHKSQGMSLDAAQIDLSKAFVPGQGYVALSRLRSLSGLELLGLNEEALKVSSHVLEKDKALKSESERWSKKICQFSEEEMCELHQNFLIERCGKKNYGDKNGGGNRAGRSGKGSDGKLKKGKEKTGGGHDKNFSKQPTHEITLELLEKGMNLEKIASEREVKIGTIINHLEKIKELNRIPSQRFKKLCANIKPAKKTLQEIKKICQKTPDAKLTVLYSKLGGKYSFEEIRVARLFVD